MTTRENWFDALRSQIEFYSASAGRTRTDQAFDWAWQARSEPVLPSRMVKATIKQAWTRLRLPPFWKTAPYSASWLRDHLEQVWLVRGLLHDEVSRILFDTHLVLRATDHQHFAFPRTDFEDLFEVGGRTPFSEPGLPRDYLGLPLFTFEGRLVGTTDRLRVVSTELQIRLLNWFRQYLVVRDGVALGPRAGDVVFDCGAISLVLAATAGASGQVQLFDLVPLQAQYCQLQAAMNADLASRLHINTIAVGAQNKQAVGPRTDARRISSGGFQVDTFDTTSLYSYFAQQRLDRVDFIKMDIEGAELDALHCEAAILQTHRPRLAVSSYNKPADLWQIPLKIKALNPQYRLFFRRHSPVHWESVDRGA